PRRSSRPGGAGARLDFARDGETRHGSASSDTCRARRGGASREIGEADLAQSPNACRAGGAAVPHWSDGALTVQGAGEAVGGCAQRDASSTGSRGGRLDAEET